MDSQPPAEALSREDVKALVVDDNMMMRRIISDQLGNIGFVRIDDASSGEAAWDMINEAKGTETPYDVVFLDWNMPGMSGYDLLQKCREDCDLHKMAIVMVTAEDLKRSVLEAIKAGATFYMVKPVTEEDLEKMAGQVLEWLAKVRAI